MKPNPAIVWQCLEIEQITKAKNLSSANIWNNGVLTAAHIWGLALLPNPMPAIGTPHTLRP